MDDARIDALLAAWLRGEKGVVLDANLEASCGPVLERIDFHGIAGLLSAELRDQVSLPDVLARALRDRAIALAFWEANHARMLGRVLPALAARGIAPLLFKGTALAFSHYADPAARARGDTDMLVAPDEFDRAGEVLTGLGFATPLLAGGSVISVEKTFTFTDPAGVEHDIDLHGRLNNAAILARLFAYEELLGRAVDLPGLSPGARSVGAVDALLIACMHRMVHLQAPYYVNAIAYRSANRLIWLHDIHLLASRFSASDWDGFLTLAHRKGLAQVCAGGLRSARDALATRLPKGLFQDLGARKGQEIPARYLAAGPLGQMVMKLRAEDGLARKARFLREVMFPPAEYMRARFGDVRPPWLPWLYVARAIGGIRKLVPDRAGAK